MNNRVLKLYIKSFKNQKTEVFPRILRVFKRLISHYANLLDGEDAQQELNLFFIELLFSIDIEKFTSDNSSSLARYIAVAIKNKYIELFWRNSRYKSRYLPFSENFFISGSKIEFRLEMADMLNFLSEKQRKVIVCKYFYNYSDAEISNILGISRQAVNNLKNRALKTLRQFYIE